MSDLCIHELPEGQCSHCKLPPRGINKIVYITKGGNTFHNRSNCSTLASGQSKAEEMDLNIHAITPISWSQVANTRKPCRNCCS